MMAEQEKQEQTEQAEEERLEEPESGAPGAQTSEGEPADEAQAAETEEAKPAEEEQAPETEEPEPAEQAEPAPQAAAGGDELEGLDWKARRRLLRSRESGSAAPQRSAAERAADRSARRRAAAAERRRHRAQRRKRSKAKAGEGTPPSAGQSVARKMRQGTVVSSKPDKTITVRIDVARRHPAYEKIVRQSRTLRAHDEGNEAGEGDLVRVVETRPLSRTKRWRLVEILERAK
jgi:small subunit ribosomal protein S17